MGNIRKGIYYGPLEVISTDKLSAECKCSECGEVNRYNIDALESGEWKTCTSCWATHGRFEIGEINKAGLEILGYITKDLRNASLKCKCSKGHTTIISKESFIANRACKTCIAIMERERKQKEKENKVKETDEKQPCRKRAIRKIKFDNVKNIRDIEIETLSECTPIDRVETNEVFNNYNREEQHKAGEKKDTRYVNRVINGLLILDDDFGKTTRTAIVKCTTCNNIFKVKLYKLIKCEAVCPVCADNVIEIKYSRYYEDSLKIRLKDMYKGGIVTSDGKKYNLFKYGVLRDAKAQIEENISKFNEDTYGMLDSVKNDSGLMYSSTPAMVDRELHCWYNCYCSVHGKPICVRDDNIDNFKHKECRDENNIPIPIIK